MKYFTPWSFAVLPEKNYFTAYILLNCGTLSSTIISHHHSHWGHNGCTPWLCSLGFHIQQHYCVIHWDVQCPWNTRHFPNLHQLHRYLEVGVEAPLCVQLTSQQQFILGRSVNTGDLKAKFQMGSTVSVTLLCGQSHWLVLVVTWQEQNAMKDWCHSPIRDQLYREIFPKATILNGIQACGLAVVHRVPIYLLVKMTNSHNYFQFQFKLKMFSLLSCPTGGVSWERVSLQISCSPTWLCFGVDAAHDDDDKMFCSLLYRLHGWPVNPSLR